MERHRQRHWLEIAEYVSLASSVVGAIAAAVSQQLVSVGLAVPLTLTVFLDIVNRHRVQQLYQQQTNSIVADVRAVVECLHQQVQTQPDTAKPESLPKLIENHIAVQVEQSTRSWAIQINQHLERIKPYDYQLVSDRGGSRDVLIAALAGTQQRLIIVSPWLTRSSINAEVLQGFSRLLERQVRIDIGWGHLRDTGLNEPAAMDRQQLLAVVSQNDKGWKYEGLPELEQMERQYPGLFRLKLLLTNEKFLVSLSGNSHQEMGSFAMLGSHDLLSWDGKSPEREVGMKTNDPRIVGDLIARFDRATNYDLACQPLENKLNSPGQLADAIATYQQVSTTEPNNAEAYNNLAIALMSQGKRPEAIAVYRKLLQLEPNNPVVYTSLGNALFEQGHRSQALAAYQKVIEINPTYTYAYNNLGKVLEEEGKLTEALGIYRQALTQPEQLGKPASAHTLAHNNAGVVLAKLGNLKDAIAEFQQAIELDSNYVEARNNLQKAQLLAALS